MGIVDTEKGWTTVAEPYAESHDFDAEPVLVGKYLGMRTIQQPDMNDPDKKRDVNLYEFETPDGSKSAVWGSFTIDAAFAENAIPVGNLVRIVYEGKLALDNGARSVKRFTVQTKSPRK
jgi:hypothetical protein